MKTASPELSDVLEHHARAGAIAPINDTVFDVTSPHLGVSATIRVLPGRAVVDFGGIIPDAVPSSLVLREQLTKFGGSFYASAEQLNGFLREMSGAR